MNHAELIAREGVRQTLNRYHYFADRGRTKDLVRLFTDPCHFEIGQGFVYRTHTEIATAVEDIKRVFLSYPPIGRIRHHISSVHIELTSPSEARASSYFLAMAASGPDHWGIYLDELALIDGAWLFTKRLDIVEGVAKDSPVRHLLDSPAPQRCRANK